MKGKKILFGIILFLVLTTSVFAKIVVETIGTETTETGSATDVNHKFIINKYYPYSQPVIDLPEIMVEQITAEDTINPCEEAHLSFKLTNPTTQLHTYKLNVDDFTGLAYITPNIALNSGDSAIINYILEPECSVYGDINPKIIVETENEEAAIPVLIHINKAYDYSVEFEENIALCNNVESRLTIQITNKAGLDNSYTIQVNKDWVYPEFSEISLNSGEMTAFGLVLNPAFKTEAISTVIVEVIPEYGDKALQKLVINTEDCYKQDFKLPVKKVCENTNELDLYLNNKGLFEETFEISLEEAEDFMFLEKNRFLLGPGEDTRVPIILSSDKTPGRYDLVIKSHVKDKPEFFDKEIKAELEIIELDECFLPRLITKRITVSSNNESRLLEIKNLGLGDELYKIELVAPEFVSIEQDELFLGKSSSDVVLVFTEPDEEGKYTASLILTSVITETKYVEEFTIIVSDFTLLSYITQNKCCIMIALLAILAVIFFIKFLTAETKRKGYTNLLVIAIALIIMLFVSLICFDTIKTKYGLEYQNNVNETENLCLTYYDEPFCESTYYINFQEGTKYAFDLSKLFYDPDSDDLTYTVSDIEDFDIRIKGSVVTLIPEKDWYGIREIMFTASDEKGGYAESRKFVVHILNKEEFYVQDFVLDNHVYLSLGFIILITLLIVFLIYNILSETNNNSKKKKKK